MRDAFVDYPLAYSLLDEPFNANAICILRQLLQYSPSIFNYLVLYELRDIRHPFLVGFIAALRCIKGQVRHYSWASYEYN